MKYTEQEQIKEILHRGKKLRQRRDRNLLGGFSATATALLFALTACIAKFGGTGVLESRTDYGSFLLSAETGGYVLTAVLAFVVGVITTVIIKKRMKYNSLVTNSEYAQQIEGKNDSRKGSTK